MKLETVTKLSAYLFIINEKQTVVLAKNIAEALDKAEKEDPEAEMQFYRELVLIV